MQTRLRLLRTGEGRDEVRVFTTTTDVLVRERDTAEEHNAADSEGDRHWIQNNHEAHDGQSAEID